MEKLTKSEPHGEHVVYLADDAEKPENRIYQITDTEQSSLQFTGEELDWLCKWWAKERKKER